MTQATINFQTISATFSTLVKGYSNKGNIFFTKDSKAADPSMGGLFEEGLLTGKAIPTMALRDGKAIHLNATQSLLSFIAMNEGAFKRRKGCTDSAAGRGLTIAANDLHRVAKSVRNHWLYLSGKYTGKPANDFNKRFLVAFGNTEKNQKVLKKINALFTKTLQFYDAEKASVEKNPIFSLTHSEFMKLVPVPYARKSDVVLLQESQIIEITV